MSKWKAIMFALLRVLLIISVHLLMIFILNIRLAGFDFKYAVGMIPLYILPLSFTVTNSYLYNTKLSSRYAITWLAVSIIPSSIFLYYIKSTYELPDESVPFFSKYSLELSLIFPMSYLVLQFVLLLAWLSVWNSKRENMG